MLGTQSETRTQFLNMRLNAFFWTAMHMRHSQRVESYGFSRKTCRQLTVVKTGSPLSP